MSEKHSASSHESSGTWESSGDSGLASARREVTHATATESGEPTGTHSSAGPSETLSIGRYQLCDELGRGGMGVVYRAHDPELGRDVALKVVRAGSNADDTQNRRFSREARAVARLEHPNIVEVYDMGTYDGSLYFTMQYIEGTSLASHIGGETVEPREAARLAHGIARALACAHKAGLVHRDVKPSNILLDDDTPKLSDFGLVKQIEHDEATAVLTRGEQMLGTPAYMAPEQLAVGKELVARALHSLSPRRDRPWVAVNLAAVPASTAASALFGHRRGAFTGAEQARAGYFAQADGGTLFLDEVGETAGDIQPQLLRALENHEIQPVGGAAKTVDARVITATDADLEQLVASGRFRRALLHRLQVTVINVPPLRARPADIPILLHHFLRLHLREHDAAHLLHARVEKRKGREWLRLSLLLRLMRHEFPGNVRELYNIAAQLALDGHKRTRPELPEDLAAALRCEEDDGPRPGVVSPETPGTDDMLSADKLISTLREHRFSVARSARALGISKNTLTARIRETPDLRLAGDLTCEEIVEAGERVGANIDSLGEELRVSAHGLRLRMRELGLR